ncbi:hypothetical protein GCM10020256_40380 [Streptomyces thermocoprophilus]
MTRTPVFAASPTRSSTSAYGRAPLTHPAHIRAVSATVNSEEAALLEHHAGARAYGVPLGEGIMAEDADAARGRPGEPFQQFHGGGLSGAVRAEQREDLAVFHVERDAAHRLEPAPRTHASGR